MELYLVAKNGEVVEDIGTLIESDPSSGAISAQEQPKIPDWVQAGIVSIVAGDGWQSLRSADPTEDERWCVAIERGGHELYLVLRDWVPVATLVEGPSSLATVIHDLKNPIGAIFGYADALLDTELGAGLDPSHSSVVGRIRKAALRSLDLLKNYESLLYIGRKKQVPLSDLNKIVKLVCDTSLARRKSMEGGGGPVFEVDQQEGTMLVKIPRFALDRIVANLVGNASKFTPPEGTIAVRTFLNGENAVLEVSNSGPLIEEKEKDSIFEARVRGSSARDVAGTGMGLYTVKVLVESVGGAVELSVGAEHGNSFRVSIPLAPAGTSEHEELFLPE